MPPRISSESIVRDKYVMSPHQGGKSPLTFHVLLGMMSNPMTIASRSSRQFLRVVAATSSTAMQISCDEALCGEALQPGRQNGSSGKEDNSVVGEIVHKNFVWNAESRGDPEGLAENVRQKRRYVYAGMLRLLQGNQLYLIRSFLELLVSFSDHQVSGTSIHQHFDITVAEGRWHLAVTPGSVS